MTNITFAVVCVISCILTLCDLQNIDAGSCTDGDTEKVSMANDKDSVWENEDIRAPYTGFMKIKYVNVRQSQAASPAKKNRKEEGLGSQGEKTADNSKELQQVEAFRSKLIGKIEELKQLVKESSKTKTEFKTATRQLVHIVETLPEEWICAQVSEMRTNYLSVGVQADESEIIMEIAERDKDMITEIENEMDERAG